MQVLFTVAHPSATKPPGAWNDAWIPLPVWWLPQKPLSSVVVSVFAGKKRCDRRRPRERGLRCVAASTKQNAGFRCCDDGRRSAGVSHQASIKVFQRRFALKQIASPRAVRFPPFDAVAAPTQCPVRFSISPKPASCILYDHPPVVKR